MRKIALSLLSGIPDPGVMGDFAETPDLSVVGDLAELWMELTGWVPNGGPISGDFETGEKGEKVGEVDHEDIVDHQDHVGANKRKVFDVNSMEVISMDQSGESSTQDWNAGEEEKFLAVADGDSCSELSSWNGSVLSFRCASRMTLDASKNTLAMTEEAFAMEDSKMTEDFAKDVESVKIELFLGGSQ